MNRKEYMEDSANLHRAYYAQFVTPYIRRNVSESIGIDTLEASRDPHFNDIPLHKWDRLSECLRNVLAVDGEIEYGPDYKGKKYYSLCTGVCILKEAARQILEQKLVSEAKLQEMAL